MTACCFTGHRTYKLGLDKNRQDAIKEKIKDEVEKLIKL